MGQEDTACTRASSNSRATPFWKPSLIDQSLKLSWSTTLRLRGTPSRSSHCGIATIFPWWRASSQTLPRTSKQLEVRPLLWKASKWLRFPHFTPSRKALVISTKHMPSKIAAAQDEPRQPGWLISSNLRKAFKVSIKTGSTWTSLVKMQDSLSVWWSSAANRILV